MPRSRKTLLSVLSNLHVVEPLPPTPNDVARAGEAFRRIWLVHKGVMEAGCPSAIPPAISEYCFFASAVAHAIFRTNVRANWQHVWTTNEDGAIIDLSGLKDVPLEQAIAIHVRMLRNQGFEVTSLPDGTFQVSLPLGTRRLRYPSVVPDSFFEADDDFLDETEFIKRFESVVPRCKAWSESIHRTLK